MIAMTKKKSSPFCKIALDPSFFVLLIDQLLAANGCFASSIDQKTLFTKLS